jgi:2-desacetyl-2-hydroxyethyl bacteriochlorophyllide A dehydrogenase
MQAAFIEDFGPPSAIRYGAMDDPEPGPTDVLVQVSASTVNHVDTFVRSGAWRTPVPFPFVIGRDLVGTVAAVGPGAVGFEVGDRVWSNSLGYAGRQGAASEYAVVPVERLYHLPPEVAPEDAVVVLHPAATAYLGLFTHGRMQRGETAVVVGAGGNVGSAMLSMGRAAGITTIAVASARDADYCRSLGAAEVVDYRAPDVADQIRSVCPDGVDAYIDAAGRNDVGTAVDLLARRGRLVLLAGLRSRPVLPVGNLYVKDCSIVGFAISQASAAELAEAAGFINRMLADGTLRAREAETLPLAAAAEAHSRCEAGELRGKRLVLVTEVRAAGRSRDTRSESQLTAQYSQ